MKPSSFIEKSLDSHSEFQRGLSTLATLGTYNFIEFSNDEWEGNTAITQEHEIHMAIFIGQVMLLKRYKNYTVTFSVSHWNYGGVFVVFNLSFIYP
jgi:hypothetical protein